MNNKIDRNSDIPIYEQLKKELINYVTSKEAGEFIPTEKELEEKYKVSRITVRKSVDQLVDAGYLEKIQGKGTRIINNTSVNQNLGTIFSWTEEMALKNITTTTLEKEVEFIIPSTKLKKELSLTEGEKVICMKRVRAINGEPIVIIINYLREKFIPGFETEAFETESLYEILEEKYDISLLTADETISARNSTSLEAFQLNIPEEDAVLNVRRISYLAKNVPFEVVDMVARGDKYKYLAKLQGRNNTIKEV